MAKRPSKTKSRRARQKASYGGFCTHELSQKSKSQNRTKSGRFKRGYRK